MQNYTHTKKKPPKTKHQCFQKISNFVWVIIPNTQRLWLSFALEHEVNHTAYLQFLGLLWMIEYSVISHLVDSAERPTDTGIPTDVRISVHP